MGFPYKRQGGQDLSPQSQGGQPPCPPCRGGWQDHWSPDTARLAESRYPHPRILQKHLSIYGVAYPSLSRAMHPQAGA